MTAFSLGTVWEETIAFMRRESSLLLPVGFATFGASQLLLDLGMQGQETVDPARIGGSPQALLAVPAMLVMLIGNLAVSRMVLVPGSSVGESLLAALRRMPMALLAVAIIFLIMAGIGVIVVVAATLGAIAFQADPKAVAPNIVIVLIIPAFIVMLRLMLLIPVLAVEQLGAIESLRRAWALSRDHFLRLLGVLMIILMITTLLGMLQLFVLGSLFKLLAFATGDAQIVQILEALVRAAISSVLSIAVTAYIALFFRRAAPLP